MHRADAHRPLTWLLLVTSSLLVAAAGPAPAQFPTPFDDRPLSDAKLKLKDPASGNRKLVAKGAWTGALPAFAPAQDSVSLQVGGGPGDGNSGRIALDAGSWRTLPNGRGFTYADSKGTPDDPASEPNREALEVLATYGSPFLTAFSDSDPITAGGDLFFQAFVPGAAGQPHVTVENAGHFLQEDEGDQLGQLVVDFINSGAPPLGVTSFATTPR